MQVEICEAVHHRRRDEGRRREEVPSLGLGHQVRRRAGAGSRVVLQ